jgi:hypothetical protein
MSNSQMASGRYSTSGESPPIDRMIGTTVNMLDTYLPALLSVIYANELPKEAVARVEAGWRGQ